MAYHKQWKDRRRSSRLIFVERRKGRIWMYGQMGFLAILIFYLVRLVSP